MDRPVLWDEAQARSLIDRHKHLAGAVLPILHALQEAFGYVDAAATPLIAEALNLSRAEVHGVIGFYHDFRAKPAACRVIKLCRAEACQAQGCEDLVAHARTQLKLNVDAPRPTDPAQIETVYCLGNCALGPAALVEGEVIGRLTARKLAALCAGEPVEAVQAQREAQ